MKRPAVHAGTAILAGALLAGCAGPSPLSPRDQAAVPAGSTLVLERALRVPGGSARVFVQDGRVMHGSLGSGMNRFRPRCSFRLERVGNEPLMNIIEPGRFETGTAYNRAHVRNRIGQGMQVASAADGMQLASRERGGPNPGHLTHVIEIPLSSQRQPQVAEFTCEQDLPPNWRGELGLHAIHEATGDIVTIEPAD